MAPSTAWSVSHLYASSVLLRHHNHHALRPCRILVKQIYLFLSLSTQTPKSTMLKWSTAHPVPSVAASKASLELDHIQGKRGIWFCGAYQGYGFHEDGLKVATSGQ
ncbi:hypothetical protein F2P56_002076 [Juglans regia]|uniref:Uncharacterized protein n=1 Tax=Juglans regia TaxID=51240 RepID=A0A833YFT1_JUGRE|nr:hypothetical protein F2P56_002075 [Juglans regia]KAF5481426.1 hypothetical protein F2P56_002076 [Juglans regia]